mmetsp:Transcript_45432/g.145801  ORF Transcript_45432/g.145801 Transcript_45432/m.145801 type:complete len:301 (-) Transcript_45432:13-915(-)
MRIRLGQGPRCGGGQRLRGPSLPRGLRGPRHLPGQRLRLPGRLAGPGVPAAQVRERLLGPRFVFVQHPELRGRVRLRAWLGAAGLREEVPLHGDPGMPQRLLRQWPLLPGLLRLQGSVHRLGLLHAQVPQGLLRPELRVRVLPTELRPQGHLHAGGLPVRHRPQRARLLHPRALHGPVQGNLPREPRGRGLRGLQGPVPDAVHRRGPRPTRPPRHPSLHAVADEPLRPALGARGAGAGRHRGSAAAATGRVARGAAAHGAEAPHAQASRRGLDGALASGRGRGAGLARVAATQHLLLFMY